MKTEDLYKIAIETRNLEIGLFWQRSNYFMVLNTAIAVGFFSLKNPSLSTVLAFVGAVVSFIWFKVNLGSKYWQSRWEHRASILENAIATEMQTDVNLFSANWETLNADVEASLARNDHKGFRRYLDVLVMRKPSVSYYMTLLSLFFIAFWLVAAVLTWAR